MITFLYYIPHQIILCTVIPFKVNVRIIIGRRA